MSERQPSIEHILELLMRLRRAIHEQMPHTHRWDPSSMLQAHVLYFLAAHERATMSDIAKEFQITAPSATVLIRRLAARKLIARKSGRDRRATLLSITPRGKAATKAAGKAIREKMTKILQALSPKSRRHLAEILQELYESYIN